MRKIARLVDANLNRSKEGKKEDIETVAVSKENTSERTTDIEGTSARADKDDEIPR